MKEYSIKNSEILKQKRSIRHNIKMKDPLYLLKYRFNRRLSKSLKRGKYIHSSSIELISILGCSFEEFKIHIESKPKYTKRF